MESQAKIEKRKAKLKQIFAQINQNSFMMIVALLTAIIALSGVLTYIVPQGSYQRDEAGMIINGTFQLGIIQGIPLWKILTAPVRVFFSDDSATIIMISVFLLVMSGVFNLLEKTEGMRCIIGKAVRKFSNRKSLVVCLTTFVFMLFGSFFGMFEELVTLLPLVIVFTLSMGFDTMTGLGVCLMAACFGFSAAITNPFSVGIVAELAGTHALDGVWLRLIFFAIVYTMVCLFLMQHIRKIRKDPTRSISYEIDQRKREALDLSIHDETEHEKKVFRVYAIFFLVQIAVLLLIAGVRAISGYAMPILAVSFLVGGIIAGCNVCEDKKTVFKHLASGAVTMLPAIGMIALATSVKLIMSESGILDTVMYGVITMLEGHSKYLCVVLIYILILFLQIFIGSSSAKIMLIMPILLPIATTLGLSHTVIMLVYCIADGFTDVILPTNPVLLIGLSMANISYGKWVRWTWKFQLLMFIVTLAILLFAVHIGY